MLNKSKDKLSTLADEELVDRFRHSHDNKYLGYLYLKYSHLVLGLSLKYFKNMELANDAVMDVFELIPRKLKKHKVENFKSWLYTLSKNHCLQKIRTDKSISKKRNAFEVFLNSSVENEEGLHLLKEKEKLLNKLEEALPLLKENQQNCIKAFYLENKSYQQISKETGLSLNEIKSNIQNGKRNLKIKMTE